MSLVNWSRQVLLICNDTIGDNMAGPGIRYWEFSRVLSQYFSVTLAIPPFVDQTATPNPSFQVNIISCKTEGELFLLAQKADVVVTVGDVLSTHPSLLNVDKPLVLDIYIPYILEGLNAASGPVPTHQHLFYREKERHSLNTQLRVADFMICASDKQRDYWLGLLSSLGRVNPYTHGDDKTLRKLIDVVPFGLPEAEAKHTTPVLKGVFKTIQADDFVLIWNGGIWEWFDTKTLIKAMPKVIEQIPHTKLFFMGINRPNRTTRSAVEETIALSKSLELYETHIFFNDWVPYQERQNYLLEADLGVSLHFDHVETKFSFRTRFLDHLWTGLPLLATEGDILSSELAALGLARTVKPEDIDGVAQAIIDMLSDKQLRQQYQAKMDHITANYQWETVLQPLINFCAAPYFAPDKAYLKITPVVEIGPTKYWQLPRKVWLAYKHHGLTGLVWQSKEYLAWKLIRLGK